jgi:hypothetical protein
LLADAVLRQVVIRAAMIPTVTTIDDRSDRDLSLGKDAPEPRPVRTPRPALACSFFGC